MKFAITPHASPVAAENPPQTIADPGFGRVFTDHMVTLALDRRIRLARWPGQGARAIRHRPGLRGTALRAGNFRRHEGLSHRQRPVVLFRPDMNAARFARSAERLAMPTMPEAVFIEAVKALVKIDKDWVPSDAGSLYLRPFHVRERSLPRRAPVAGIHVLRDRLPGRAVLQRRRQTA